MLDVLYKVEQISGNFNSTALLGVGVVLGLVGLCIWLGGLGFVKISSAIIGAIIGWTFGYLVKSHVIMLIVFSTLAGCVAFLLLEKMFTVILGYGTATWNFVYAASYSTLGTIFIFLAMILLLLYKGSGPIEHIAQKQMFYVLILLAMVVFGTVIQLLLCKHSEEKQTSERQNIANQERQNSKAVNWRNF